MLQLIVLFVVLDIGTRKISEYNTIEALNSYQEFYRKSKISDSAMDNAIVGMFSFLAIVLFSGIKMNKGFKIKIDNGLLFIYCIVMGFFMGLLDRLVLRKDLYQDHMNKSGLWGGVSSMISYTMVCVIIVTWNSK